MFIDNPLFPDDEIEIGNENNWGVGIWPVQQLPFYLFHILIWFAVINFIFKELSHHGLMDHYLEMDQGYRN